MNREVRYNWTNANAHHGVGCLSLAGFGVLCSRDPAWKSLEHSGFCLRGSLVSSTRVDSLQV